MVRRASLPPLVLLALIAWALIAWVIPARAQPVCNELATNEWIRAGSNLPSGPALDPSLVHPVTHDLADAVTLLASRGVVPLGWQDAARFVPGAFPGRRFRPYLVRAVFPTPRPSIRVLWQGSDLHVAANGLGCAPFVKHPVVIFLDRAPGEIFVWASAAL